MADADYKAFQKRMWIAVDGPEEWERMTGEKARNSFPQETQKLLSV